MTNHRILKALTYRVGGALITFLVVYGFTGKWAVATGVGLVDQFFSTLWYYFHDKYWDQTVRHKLAKQQVAKWWKDWENSRYRHKE